MSEHNFGRAAAQATKDRATQVATDVIRVVTESLREWVHEDLRVPRPVRHEVEAILREFEDAACQARNGDPPTD